MKENGNIVKEKVFLHGLYEKITGGGVTKEHHFVPGPAGVAAIYEKTSTSSSMFYVHTDHLGSVDVITNSSGAVVERMAFDPCLPAEALAQAGGQRRNATDWSMNNVPAPTVTERGYTMHEHLDMFGLINMNGRTYNPLLARFTGADPIIQSPANMQNFNSYSYVLNNPLMYTDPSGYIYREDDREVWVNPFAIAWFANGYADGSVGTFGYGDSMFPLMGTIHSPNSTFDYDLMMAMNSGSEQAVNDVWGVTNFGWYGYEPMQSDYVTTIVETETMGTFYRENGKWVHNGHTWTKYNVTYEGKGQQAEPNVRVPWEITGGVIGYYGNFSKSSIGSNGKIYKSGWGGNGSVKTMKISTIANGVGVGMFGIGTYLTIRDSRKAIKNGADPTNTIMIGSMETTLGAFATWGGPIGWMGAGTMSFFKIADYGYYKFIGPAEYQRVQNAFYGYTDSNGVIHGTDYGEFPMP